MRAAKRSFSDASSTPSIRRRNRNAPTPVTSPRCRTDTSLLDTAGLGTHPALRSAVMTLPTDTHKPRATRKSLDSRGKAPASARHALRTRRHALAILIAAIAVLSGVGPAAPVASAQSPALDQRAAAHFLEQATFGPSAAD